MVVYIGGVDPDSALDDWPTRRAPERIASGWNACRSHEPGSIGVEGCQLQEVLNDACWLCLLS